MADLSTLELLALTIHDYPTSALLKQYQFIETNIHPPPADFIPKSKLIIHFHSKTLDSNSVLNKPNTNLFKL